MQNIYKFYTVIALVIAISPFYFFEKANDGIGFIMMLLITVGAGAIAFQQGFTQFKYKHFFWFSYIVGIFLGLCLSEANLAIITQIPPIGISAAISLSIISANATVVIFIALALEGLYIKIVSTNIGARIFSP